MSVLSAEQVLAFEVQPKPVAKEGICQGNDRESAKRDVIIH